ncbi:hypothetical protein BSZ35_04125 [Salinibacter sp. 10B]|nr:hypothetical protein BSZ35_04125 [Salinibacter sp. 10B]
MGGPISMGAPTVMINGMPAARMGDVCTCSGPPDSIVGGEPTVMINSGGNPVMIGGSGMVMIGGSGPVIIGGGAGGSGGGGGGSAGVQGAVATAAAAEGGSPEATELVEHWIDFAFEDAAGNAMAGVPYALEDPAGELSEHWLQGDGRVRRSLLPEGNGTATVKSVKGAEWSKTEATVGEEVTVTATAKGIEDGTPATVQIEQLPMDGGSSAAIVGEIETEVSGEEVEAAWTYEHGEEDQYDSQTPEEDPPVSTGSTGQQLPAYVAVVDVEGYPLPAMSGLLTLRSTVTIQLKGPDGEGVADEPYVVTFANGEVRKGTLDGSGKAELQEAPPCTHEVAWPRRSGTQRKEKQK